MRVGWILALALTGAGAYAGTAGAQELTGTLRKIKDSGTILIGHRESSLPFSYFDKNEKVVGYAVDLCYRVAEAVRTKLGLEKLEVKLVPVTAANRIPFVLNGSVDLECGSTSNNLERQKVVSFSVTYFVTANRFVAKSALGLKTLDDLKGKTIVSTIGTTNLKQISDLNGQRHLGLNIIAAKDHSEAFRMVDSGRAAAFVMDDILLYGLVANFSSPSDYAISTEALSVEPYGIMLRQQDAPFKKVVDDTLADLYRKGELDPIYAKWFLSPIPPNGVNLNVPMSPQLKRVIEKPTDSGDPSAYTLVTGEAR
jgi:glutamate/aspartate transport system substrate-binding protein